MASPKITSKKKTNVDIDPRFLDERHNNLKERLDRIENRLDGTLLFVMKIALGAMAGTIAALGGVILRAFGLI